jgi:hypothetical protein
MQELISSQQAEYIKTLILTDVVPAPLDRFIMMESLTHLEIDFQNIGDEDERRTKMKYSHVAEACPQSLMNLTIKGVNLLFRRKSINMNCVQSLKLIDVEITGKAEINDTNFPDLSVLHLGVSLTNDLSIKLPYNHLKEVTIDVEYPQSRNCTLAINTLHDGKRQRRLITTAKSDDADHSDDPFFESKPIMVDLTCVSIDKLSYSVIEKEENSDSDDYDDSMMNMILVIMKVIMVFMILMILVMMMTMMIMMMMTTRMVMIMTMMTRTVMIMTRMMNINNE